eukprot:gene11927-2175_t
MAFAVKVSLPLPHVNIDNRSASPQVGFWAMERAAEPVSRVVERFALQSPLFRNSCVWLARRVHEKETRRMNRWSASTPQ